MREDANTAYGGTADTGCASCSEEEAYRDNRDSRSGRDTNGGQAWKEVWRIAALRTVGSLGLVSFLTVMALWLFIFRGLAWQALLYPSLGGFLGSWIAAVWGMESATGRSRKKAGVHIGLGAATNLARCGFFVGAFGFVAFFLVAYR